MAGTFQFELVSPEKLLISEEVEQVILPGSEGYLTVLENHSPVLVRIMPGIIRIQFSGKEDKAFVVMGGFADLKDNVCSVLAESVTPLEAFNMEDLERSIEKARLDLEAAQTDDKRNSAEDFLHELTTVHGILTMA